jgi:hypothetical protein
MGVLMEPERSTIQERPGRSVATPKCLSTLDQLCETLELPKNWVKRQRHLPRIRVGHRTMYHPAAVVQYLKRCAS